MVFRSKRKQKNLSRKELLRGVIALVLLVAFFFIGFTKSNTSAPLLVSTQPVSLVFVGDIMMDRGVRRSIEKNYGGDYNALFTHTQYLQDADIAFANLEGPAAASGHNVGSRFSFRMDPVALHALAAAGIDIVSFANNHVGDWAQAAFDETLKNLTATAIAYTGAGTTYSQATEPRIIEVRGMKIGFLATTDVGPNWMKATDTHAGVLLASDPKLSEIIAAAKTQSDILVVSFHWGNEYSPITVRQQKLAHAAIDAGADIIVGGHPHVMQGVETYKGKPIFYSLGNFIFDQYFSPYTLQGMVGMVEINPATKEIYTSEAVAPLSKQFIPQQLIPFKESMLLTKSFTP
jgi:poly-gamma-glutamate synthesis protein (capsule biosynthesis protein)